MNDQEFKASARFVRNSAAGVIALAGIAVVGLLCFGCWAGIELVQWVVTK